MKAAAEHTKLRTLCAYPWYDPELIPSPQGEPTAYCRLLLFLQPIVYHKSKGLSIGAKGFFAGFCKAGKRDKKSHRRVAVGKVI
ncbi:hypothetical protein [uncultured Gemmiger sp.]|uniref:hypothetical protein n=1 Tax=uncultured Gemmiger sp. TaxID=1623490 RepID=UPI0025CD2D33|nr:hypothetical protein [uncultured Gemmiger sp.]